MEGTGGRVLAPPVAITGMTDSVITNNGPDATNGSGRPVPELESILDQIGAALQGLRFGQVTITVQDGVVVQIDRLERKRMARPRER